MKNRDQGVIVFCILTVLFLIPIVSSGSSHSPIPDSILENDDYIESIEVVLSPDNVCPEDNERVNVTVYGRADVEDSSVEDCLAEGGTDFNVTLTLAAYDIGNLELDYIAHKNFTLHKQCTEPDEFGRHRVDYFHVFKDVEVREYFDNFLNRDGDPIENLWVSLSIYSIDGKLDDEYLGKNRPVARNESRCLGDGGNNNGNQTNDGGNNNGNQTNDGGNQSEETREVVAFYDFERSMVDSVNGNSGVKRGASYLKKWNGHSLVFDNKRDFFVTRIDSHNLDESDFTIRGRLRTKDRWGNVILKTNGGKTEMGLSIIRGRLTIRISDGDEVLWLPGKRINDGKWHDFIASFDRQGVMKLKIDNEDVIEKDISHLQDQAIPGEFRFGTRMIGEGNFLGQIDKVRIWNYAKL